MKAEKEEQYRLAAEAKRRSKEEIERKSMADRVSRNQLFQGKLDAAAALDEVTQYQYANGGYSPWAYQSRLAQSTVNGVSALANGLPSLRMSG